MVSVRSRQLGSKGLGLNINNDISIQRVESANKKQSFIRNILNKINGGVYGREGIDQLIKNERFL